MKCKINKFNNKIKDNKYKIKIIMTKTHNLTIFNNKTNNKKIKFK